MQFCCSLIFFPLTGDDDSNQVIIRLNSDIFLIHAMERGARKYVADLFDNIN